MIGKDLFSEILDNRHISYYNKAGYSELSCRFLKKCKRYNMIDLEQYRDKWLAENVDDFIGFYNREFFCLDNFSSFKVLVDGVLYMTVEHAYQAAKFLDTAPDIAEEIINSYSAYDAQRIAHEHIDKQRADWDDVKLPLMERIVRLKLEQNPYVKRKLLETGDYLICEDSPKDSFWGIGPDRNGRNELGKLWMKIRAELRSSVQKL